MNLLKRAFSIFRKGSRETTPAVQPSPAAEAPGVTETASIQPSISDIKPSDVDDVAILEDIQQPIRHQFYTKDELVSELIKIRDRGWVENTQRGNDGAVGNVLEELLGIPNNNIPMPDATEWELKAQRMNTASLITLSHKEPAPREERIVSRILLPMYGWKHEEAGIRYPVGEKSFRQTMNGKTFTDRGFKVQVNNSQRRIEVVFDSSEVSPRHAEWLKSVEDNVGLGPLPTTPYWTFNDLFMSIGRKFYNCLYVKADVKHEGGKEYFHYAEAYFLKNVDIDKFIECVEAGNVRIEFDARTGHNHGTKMRMPFKDTPLVYKEVARIF